MRYMILGALTLACAAAISPAARAGGGEPGLPNECKKPIAQLSLEQIQDCQNMLTILQSTRAAFNQSLMERGCQPVIAGQPDPVQTNPKCK